jgi:hypothetical protein
MSDNNQIVIEEAPAVPAPVVPTREELKQKGWTAKELDAAAKRGMIAEPEGKKPEEPEAKKAEEKPAESEAKKPEEKAAEPGAKKPVVNGSLPDFSLNPEQEKAFLAAFGPGTAPRAMYFRMKNERQARQQKDGELQRLRGELDALKAALVTPKVIETDDEGRVLDPEDKPLTLKALKELAAQQSEEDRKAQQKAQIQQVRLVDAHTEQEEYARSVYSDFDSTVGLAKDLMENLDALVPEPWKQKKVLQKIKEFQAAASRADEYALDDYHAAHIVYELGQLNPKYGNAPGKSGDQTGKVNDEDPKPTGGATPGVMKRIEANTQRRAPSAAVGDGSGKRTITAEEMDLKTLLGLPAEKRLKFKQDHSSRYDKLMRG